MCDGKSRRKLAPPEDDKMEDSPGVSLNVNEKDSDDVVLDDISLAAFGATKVDGEVEWNFAALFTLQRTPVTQREENV